MTAQGASRSGVAGNVTRRAYQSLAAAHDPGLLRPYLEHSFRDDVQGLRALAVLLIITFHLWIHKVSGGVDAFFVIAGYLMGGMLLRHAAWEGRLQPIRFWAAVVLQMAPAMYLVLLCTVLLGYLYVPAPLWRIGIDGLLFSALQLENWNLVRLGSNDLGQLDAALPFQQFWVVSVQIQCYLLLVPIVAFGLRWARRWGSLAPLLLAVGAPMLGSFGYGQWVTGHDPLLGYFSPLARLWECLAGVMLALALPLLPAPRRALCLLVSLLGLLLLLGTGLLPRGTGFPGYAALLPVVAVALLLYGGARRGAFVQRLLSIRQLVYLGGMSFALYLWHWPVLAFVKHVHGIERFNLTQGLLVIGLSMLLAILTSQCVEEPVRRRFPRSQPWRVFILGVACLIPVFALWVGGKHLILETLRATERADYAADFFTDTGVGLQDNARDVPIGRFVGVKRDTSPAADDTCNRHLPSTPITLCVFGDLDASPVVMLVGGFHTSQWEPAFSEIGRRYGFRLISVSMSACALGHVPWTAQRDDCMRWQSELMALLARLRPAAVITTVTQSDPSGRAVDIEVVPEGVVDSLEAILALGIPVIGIRDTPWFRRDPSVCVWQNLARASRCARFKNEVLLAENPAQALLGRLSGLHLLDLTPLLCSEARCPAFFQGRLMWRDRRFLTRSFVHYMASAVQLAIETQAPILPRR